MDTSDDRTLGELRAEIARGRLIAMPLAGAVAWTAAGICGVLLPVHQASLALFICLATVFPLG